MPSCVHGNVCRAWMNKTNSFAPLSQYCPECVYFKLKNDVSDPHNTIDEVIDELNLIARLMKGDNTFYKGEPLYHVLERLANKLDSE